LPELHSSIIYGEILPPRDFVAGEEDVLHEVKAMKIQKEIT